MTDQDIQFFTDHPDRRARIRAPEKVMETDPRTRRTRVRDECEGELWLLGDHARDRRRILVWRSPENKLLKIPFLLFADEAVEDSDAVLLPIVHEIMRGAKRRYDHDADL